MLQPNINKFPKHNKYKHNLALSEIFKKYICI